MKVAPLQSNFSGGEISPLLYGRVDSERYKEALAICENYIPAIQGGVTRRPGSYFVAETQTSSKKSRLVSFEFSTTQAYILEFGDLYIRFYRDNAQIESGGSPYEVVSPYAEADLFQLKFTQSADVLYIVHPSYAPRKLTRTAHTSWTLTEITFLDGPYLNTNTTTTTLNPSGTTGAITITASAPVFTLVTDVGRMIRIRYSTTWGYARITAVASTTSVSATVVKDFSTSGSGTTTWRLGLYSATTGYPSAVVFHEDRLFLAGAAGAPQRFDGSRTGDYENFQPTDYDSTATFTATHALGFVLNANTVNVIRWMTSDEKGLLIGTVGGEWSVRASSLNEAISPVNIAAKPTTSYGSANIQPVQSGKATIHVQRDSRKIREMIYFYDVDGFRSPDLTVLSEHVTESGVTQLARQQSPQSIVWATKTDGVLAAMTYERESDQVVAGWHRHIFGGVSNSAGDAPIVESVAIIPAPSADRDEMWLIIRRSIGGTTKRYVEYLTKVFEDTDDQRDAFFVDSGLTYDDPKDITGATSANPVVITSTAHGFSNGDIVIPTDVVGMTELNGNSYTVANATANTFELSGINGTSYTTYVSGGVVRKTVTTVSGLSHLNGETVSILADGAVLPNVTVSAGAVTLPSGARAGTVNVGLPYVSKLKMLRPEAGSQDGTALGKTRRIHRIGLLLHRSLGLKLGFDFSELDSITFRTSADPMTRAPSLFSGVLSESISSDYNFETQICIQQDQPLPSMILAVMPQLVTQDR